MNRLWQKFRASAFVSLCTDFAPASAIGMYGLLAIISIIFDEVISLFCLTSVELGGIGFDEKRIGKSNWNFFVFNFSLIAFRCIADRTRNNNDLYYVVRDPCAGSKDWPSSNESTWQRNYGNRKSNVLHENLTRVTNKVITQSYFIVPAVNNFVDSTPALWIVLLLTMAVRTFGNTLVFTSTFVMVR